MLTKAQAHKLMLSIPGTDERPWFNEPSVFIHDRFLSKAHKTEDAVTLQVGSMEMRDMMLEAEPDLFYITDHYRKFPFVLIRLRALTAKTMKEILVGRATQLAQMKPIRRKAKPPGKEPRTVTTKEIQEARGKTVKKTAVKTPKR